MARFFEELPHPIDHVMVTAGPRYYAPLPEIDFAQARRGFDEQPRARDSVRKQFSSDDDRQHLLRLRVQLLEVTDDHRDEIGRGRQLLANALPLRARGTR